MVRKKDMEIIQFFWTNLLDLLLQQSQIIYTVKMGGKKWCEYCHINLPYDKKAIKQHEATKRHIQNQQKHIKFQRIKIQRQERAARQIAKTNSFTSTANIPKAKKGSQLQKEVQQYRNDIISKGKMAIHQLIAQRTQGVYGAPIQYPQKQDLVLAQNYVQEHDEKNQSIQQKYQMWKIDICQQTGNACFINRITQAKTYQPPKGYVMSQQQKQQWQQTKKICEQIQSQNMEQVGEVGKWEEAQQQDYFQQHKAEPQDSQNQQHQEVNEANGNQQKYEMTQLKKQTKVEQKQKGWLDLLQEKVTKNQVNQSEVVGTILTNTLQECRNIKQKNEALKKLIRDDFQIRATLNKNDQELLKQESSKGNKMTGIKPRKKVKTCQISDQKDLV